MKKFIEDPNHAFAKDTAHGVGSLWDKEVIGVSRNLFTSNK